MKKTPKMATFIATSPTGNVIVRDDFEIPPRSTLRQIREKGEEVALEAVETLLSVPENGFQGERPAHRWTFEVTVGGKCHTNALSIH